MKVEVWSNFGLEGVVMEPLLEVVQGENTGTVGLLGRCKWARVWLDSGDVAFLREMLDNLPAAVPPEAT